MSWIKFEYRRDSPSGKTKQWEIVPNEGGKPIGAIAWHPPWRKYCFFPYGNTVFEEACLRDIATFCQTQTREHKGV